MSDNMPAKFITVWPWHHDESALYLFSANSNKLHEKFGTPQFLLVPVLTTVLTMTIFFEIAV